MFCRCCFSGVCHGFAFCWFGSFCCSRCWCVVGVLGWGRRCLCRVPPVCCHCWAGVCFVVGWRGFSYPLWCLHPLRRCWFRSRFSRCLLVRSWGLRLPVFIPSFSGVCHGFSLLLVCRFRGFFGFSWFGSLGPPGRCPCSVVLFLGCPCCGGSLVLLPPAFSFGFPIGWGRVVGTGRAVASVGSSGVVGWWGFSSPSFFCGQTYRVAMIRRSTPFSYVEDVSLTSSAPQALLRRLSLLNIQAIAYSVGTRPYRLGLNPTRKLETLQGENPLHPPISLRAFRQRSTSVARRRKAQILFLVPLRSTILCCWADFIF